MYAASNVTVTVNTNSVTITGTTSASGKISPVALRSSIAGKANNTWYTCRFSIKNASSNVEYCYLAHDATDSVAYVKESNLEDSIKILKWDSNVTVAFQPMFRIDTSISQTFSITFYDLAIYEGEFKNPPITTGLDVKPGNQFLLADRSNYKTYLSCLTGFEGTINTHKRSDDIYEDVFSLGMSQNTGGAFHDCIHVKMIAFIHSSYSYHMSIAEFDISLMQYGTYGIPDATILNKNIQDITHTNQSGTGSHICIKLDDIKILRDPTNDRILKLQAKVLNSLTTNWDNSREATAHVSVEINAFGYNNAAPKILLNSYTLYYGQYNNVY